MEEEHVRRKRYSGKYPKHFDEKYKELNPEKYIDTIQKVISKGNTPAGMHLPIMVNEIMDFFQIQEGQVGIDATLGYGGHTKVMLEKLNHTGHIYGLDVDEIEIVKTKERLEACGYGEKEISIQNRNFKELDQVLPSGVKCDFLLADLGISSMQVDNPERGFSFKQAGPLDLRLDPLKGVPASDLLMQWNKEELEQIFIENADEPYAKELAEKICEKKSYGPIDTTTKLHDIIKETLEFLPKYQREVAIKKTSQRVFQALRIETNQEFSVLDEFLFSLPYVMKSGGKIAILTFHSGEDRLVKKAFKAYLKEGVFSSISESVVRPTEEEIYQNPRAKSTKFRWAIVK
jgi:16S rRNA (cytosine1402-N4)-methyltransferase